jgi:DNA-binding transcriptional LysR family regulator
MRAAPAKFSTELDWNLLKVFNAIVEAGGVSPAARLIGRKQPAVSLALKRLEAEVGARLCLRGPGGFRLTDAGRRVAEIAAGLERGVTELPPSLSAAAREVRGRIRLQLISNVVSPALDRALAAFHARYPEVDFVIEVDTWDAIGRALLRGEADIGVAPARFQHAQLRYDLLSHEVQRPYCGRGHPLYGRRVANPAALADHGFVLTGDDEPDDLTKFRLRHGLGRHLAGVSEHLEEAKRLALAGVGICFLPEEFARPEVRQRRLWPLGEGRQGPTMALYVITNPGAPGHLAGQLFLAELGRALPKNPVRARK